MVRRICVSGNFETTKSVIDKRVKLLKNIDAFNNYDEAKLNRLAHQMQPSQKASNHVFFRQGEISKEMHFILQGEVTVLQNVDDDDLIEQSKPILNRDDNNSSKSCVQVSTMSYGN